MAGRPAWKWLQRIASTALVTLLGVVAGAMGESALAGPANIQSTVVEQPDGTRLEVQMRGDEFQGWMETSDGYTIVRNPANATFEYATKGGGGELLPSGIVALPDATTRAGLIASLPEKGLRPPRNVELEAYQGELLDSAFQERLRPTDPLLRGQTGTWKPVPVSGAKKMLVVLVNFADATLNSSAPAYWYDTVFNTGKASVATYYQDNSYGNLVVSPVSHTQAGSPTGVVKVTLTRNHPACTNACTYATESAIINAALAAAAPYVNFASLDTNGDGAIAVSEALFYFIYAGYESSAGSGLAPAVWAHAWGGSGVSVGGKTVPRWALNGEWYDASNRMAMGVVAHELGHQMAGLPDLYDISGTNAGLGIFSLMAGGSWGARSGEIGGVTAVGLDAWSRQYLGWTTLQTPTNGQAATLVSGLQSANSVYILMNEAVSSSEFWLVENRPPVSWDAGIYSSFRTTWQGGLLIQHIDLNIGTAAGNSFNKYVAGSHQGAMVEEPATKTCTLTGKTSRGCPTLFYYAGNSTSFNDATTPSSRYYAGNSSSLGISAVSAPGTSMTATFTTVAAADTAPDAFTFTAQNGVALSAAVTSNTITPVGYTAAAAISVTGGQYSIGCSATFTAAAGTIAPGQSVCVKHTAAASAGSSVTTTLTIGGVSGGFTSTTIDTTPDAFSFTSQVGAAAGASVTSNAITPAGYSAAAPISVAGGLYSIGCGATFTATAGTITPGQSVCVRLTASSTAGASVTTTLTIGGVAGTFTTTTAVAVKTLSSLAINGVATVNESSTASYTATATYSDGSSATVTPTWSEDSAAATISAAGVLTTSAVTSNQAVTISASYTQGGITKTATKAVTIVDVGNVGGTAATTTALLLTGLSGTAGAQRLYTVAVPSGAANLVVTLDGGTGDVDLYVKAGATPGNSIDASDCASYTSTATEVCAIPAPQAAMWYLLLDAYAAYSNVTLRVTYETPVTLSVQKAGSGSGTVQSTTVSSAYAVTADPVAAETRIVGGSYAAASSWPWQLQVTVTLANGSWMCGGSLLSSRWALTAGHCVDSNGATVPASAVLVRLGTLTWGSGGQQVAVSRVIRQPQYDAVTTDNDLALLELATPVTLSAAVAPIAPLLPIDEALLAANGRLATVTGWGTTATGGDVSTSLRQVTLPLLTSAACRATGYGNQITDNMICAGYAFGDKDSCQGDSGGPLVVPNGRGGYALAGIVSWGLECAAANYPGVYTRVANYRGWLEATTGLSFGAPLIDCGASCSARLGLASTVTLAATAAAGSSFTGWSGACTGTGTCTVTMSAAQTVTATFVALTPSSYALTLSKTGDGIGKVTSSPVGIDCGANCSSSVVSGTKVTLTASLPYAGSAFNGWGGACSSSGTAPSCQVTVTAATTVTASFRYTGSSSAWNAARDAYVSYYGRPGDPQGLAYWAGQTDLVGGDLRAVIASFGTSGEFAGRYGGLTNTQLVTKVYQQVLGHDPDAGGLAWYVGELDAGRRTLQTIALDVLNGATAAPDSTAVANKREVAAYYTAKVAAGCDYGNADYGASLLLPVNATAASVTAAKAVINTRCGP